MPVSELVVRKFTNGRFAQNSYLLGDARSRAAVLVDPGEDPGGLLAEVTRGGWRVEGIWLTHAHIDHVLGVPQAKKLTSAPVLLHPADQPLYANVPQQAAMMGFAAPSLPAPDGGLREGQELRVGPHEFVVRHTPGHSPGSVSFVGPGRVIVGDVLFSGSIGRTDLPGGNFFTLMRSIHAHLLTLPDDTVLHAGHGDDSTIGVERATNPFITGEVRAG
jgi:glyoxylase-like metal-dependent hydrolase (beta-lactamase superfamily II)